MKSYITDVTKIWDDLKNAVLEEEKYKDEKIFRISPILLNSCNNVYASSNIIDDTSVLVEFDKHTLEGFNFPNFFGIELYSTKNESINPNKIYFVIKRKQECEIELFIAFSISLIQELSKSTSDVESVDTILKVLDKYKTMFSKDDSQLPKRLEQGLYCELLYLEKIIDVEGDEVIVNWVGPEANKHDFIFKDYAVEIKSTSNQEQTIIRISNENQLNKFDLSKLFLKVYTIETNPRGEYLHDIIKRISSKINNSEMYSRFLTCLLLEGIDPLVYKGKYCFKIVSEKYYDVDDNFPKIIKDNMPNEAFDVEYKLNLSGVKEYEENSK